MTPKKAGENRRDRDREQGLPAWGRGQEDWFGAPGDVDDFIFYDFFDPLGGGCGEDDWPRTSSR